MVGLATGKKVNHVVNEVYFLFLKGNEIHFHIPLSKMDGFVSHQKLLPSNICYNINYFKKKFNVFISKKRL